MANRYVDSATGSNADNGSTWALAKASEDGAYSIDTAGDFVFFASTHAESTANHAGSWAGTAASPTKLLSVSTAAEPPTTLVPGASITATASNLTIAVANAFVYAHGLTYISTSIANIVNPGFLVAEQCTFFTNNGSASPAIELASAASATFEGLDCLFRFSAAGQGFACTGQQTLRGGGLHGSTTGPTVLFKGLAARSRTRLEGFDASAGGSGMDICSGTGDNISFYWENGKLPASWNGDLHTSTPGEGSVYEMVNVDSGDTTYRYWKAETYGSVRDESVIVRTGGAEMDGVPFSYKMVSTANAEFPMHLLASRRIGHEITAVGSPVTLTMHFMHDSVTALKDDEVFVKVQYQGTSGYPLGNFVSDAKADILATAANQDASGESWTTTGLTNPNAQQLEVTFTPEEPGMVYITVYVVGASKTIYLCPQPELS